MRDTKYLTLIGYSKGYGSCRSCKHGPQGWDCNNAELCGWMNGTRNMWRPIEESRRPLRTKEAVRSASANKQNNPCLGCKRHNKKWMRCLECSRWSKLRPDHFIQA